MAIFHSYVTNYQRVNFNRFLRLVNCQAVAQRTIPLKPSPTSYVKRYEHVEPPLDSVQLVYVYNSNFTMVFMVLINNEL